MHQKYAQTKARIVTDRAKLAVRCEETTLDAAADVVADLLKCARILDSNPKLGCLGLAANQIGYNVRVIVVKNARGFFRPLINPVVVPAEGAHQRAVTETCFSLPGVTYVVDRWSEVLVSADNFAGQHKVRGMTAICFQHELDHLNGIVP